LGNRFSLATQFWEFWKGQRGRMTFAHMALNSRKKGRTERLIHKSLD